MGVSVAVLALFSSCSSRLITSSSADLTPIVRPIMADLEVQSTKVSGTFTTNHASWSSSEDAIVRNAIFQALNSVKADVLVGMQYQITEVRSSTGSLVEKTAVVTGYPAFYRNIRPLPNDEVLTKELKEGTPYLIKEKNGVGDEKIYTIITTTNNSTPVIDLKDAEVDKVILSKERKGRR